MFLDLNILNLKHFYSVFVDKYLLKLYEESDDIIHKLQSIYVSSDKST